MSSHQRFPSSVEVKEPHSVSLKVLRLARPSLVPQYPLHPPNPISSTTSPAAASSQPPPSESLSRPESTAPASLAYAPARPAILNALVHNTDDDDNDDDDAPSPPAGDTTATTTTTPHTNTNADPFVLSPILALPASFGSTYVGETFSCTLCANNEALALATAAAVAASPGLIGGQEPLTVATLRATSGSGGGSGAGSVAATAAAMAAKKKIRDVRIEAEMKTPNAATATKLELFGHLPPVANDTFSPDKDGGDNGDGSDSPSAITEGDTKSKNTASSATTDGGGGVDLEHGETLQRVLQFHLKEKGNHVLAVTVSYYEATETSGRTRTFRKLYQFVCKPALVVRTKVSFLPAATTTTSTPSRPPRRRRWVLEAQLENCSDETVQLDRVFLELEPGLVYEDLNWDAVARARSGGSGGGEKGKEGGEGERASGLLRPLVHPGEVEQVCFVVSDAGEDDGGDGDDDAGGGTRAEETADGRVMFGIMGVGWRGEMGSTGFLSTGRLGSRATTTAAAATVAQ